MVEVVVCITAAVALESLLKIKLSTLRRCALSVTVPSAFHASYDPGPGSSDSTIAGTDDTTLLDELSSLDFLSLATLPFRWELESCSAFGSFSLTARALSSSLSRKAA